MIFSFMQFVSLFLIHIHFIQGSHFTYLCFQIFPSLLFLFFLKHYHVQQKSFCIHACMHAKSLQFCLNLCDPMDCSLTGSCIQRILQARILEWVAMPSSRGSSRSGIISYIDRWVLYHKNHLRSPLRVCVCVCCVHMCVLYV